MSTLRGWHWNENDQLLDEDGADVLTGWDDETVIVCRRLGGRTGDHEAAVKALVAAAPDLLAACEWALRVEEGGRPEGAWTPYVLALRAAIAKAKGETP